MLIKVKIGKSGEMPWHWMGLISTSCPGQFFLSDDSGDYIIFSGKGMPSGLQEIPSFLSKHPAASSVVGVTFEKAIEIKTIPAGATPLFTKLYEQGLQKMISTSGRSIEAARVVQERIKTRYMQLFTLFKSINREENPFDDGIIFLLEKTAFHLVRLGNTVRNGDIGRASWYVSEVLLRDTDISQEESLLVPDAKTNASYQCFSITKKPTSLGSATILTHDFKKIMNHINDILGPTQEIIFLNNKNNSPIVDMVINFNAQGARERDVFLEQIRTAFYASALDGFYNLKWAASLSKQEFDILRRQQDRINWLEEKEGKTEEKEIQRSGIDQTRTISNESWVLSLARKTNGAHREHAFLILEGKKDNDLLIWFIDFVGNPVLPGAENGKIRICPYKSDLTDKNLLFRCERRMMDIRKSDRISSTSWNISAIAAEKFVKAIEKAEATPPRFNILGKKSIFAASTGVSSSATTGHNCFTWAKEQIHNLNDPHIAIHQDDLLSYVFSQTSRFLVDNSRASTFWYQRPLVMIGMISTAVAVTGLAVANKDTISDTCKIM